MPAKRIIILEKQAGRYRFALWADVPVARQAFYASADRKSAWTGASLQENTDLQLGAVAEHVDTIAIDGTAAQIRANLEAQWTAFQNAITNRNPWDRYGSFWDGTTWTAGGVS